MEWTQLLPIIDKHLADAITTLKTYITEGKIHKKELCCMPECWKTEHAIFIEYPATFPDGVFTRDNLLHIIQAGMTRKSLNISELERQSGVNKDTVRDFLRDKSQVLRADKLQKILHALGYNLDISERP
jgi:predicted XRE-type DNA-binding protein